MVVLLLLGMWGVQGDVWGQEARLRLGEREGSRVSEVAGNVAVSPWAGLWRCLLAHGDLSVWIQGVFGGLGADPT